MRINLGSALLILVVALATLGCGSDHPPIGGDAKQAQTAMALRDMYNKANGDWTALSSEDQAQFQKLIGNKNAEETWKQMAPKRVNTSGAGGKDPRTGSTGSTG
jgi:hypothetical protein